MSLSLSELLPHTVQQLVTIPVVLMVDSYGCSGARGRSRLRKHETQLWKDWRGCVPHWEVRLEFQERTWELCQSYWRPCYLVLLMSPGVLESISGHSFLSMSQYFWVLNWDGHTMALQPTCTERSTGEAEGWSPVRHEFCGRAPLTLRNANSASCSW